MKENKKESKFNADEIYKKLKKKTVYDEAKHCAMIVNVMNTDGRISAFCVQAGIGEGKFFEWTYRYEEFSACYEFGKCLARERWEKDGQEIRDSNEGFSVAFEHWKLTGWARFGVGRNARIRVRLNPLSDPAGHYKEILDQAASGDFTAAEIKQLMEAVNVGINTHQVFTMQKQIDELKSDLIKMNEASNGEYSSPAKGTP